MAQEHTNSSENEVKVKAVIEVLTEAYREKNIGKLEEADASLWFIYDVLREFRDEGIPERIKQRQYYEKLKDLVENLYKYLMGALYLLDENNQSLKKYEKGNYFISHVRFTDDDLFQHLEEVGIGEKEQRILAGFCRSSVYITKNQCYGVSFGTVSCLYSKTVVEHFVKDPLIKNMIQNGTQKFDSTLFMPKDSYDSDVCFMLGCFYESTDEAKANQFYQKSISTEHASSSAKLRVAEAIAASYRQYKEKALFEQALRLYNGIILKEGTTTSFVNCYGPHYYTANLAAAKLCLAYVNKKDLHLKGNEYLDIKKHVKKATEYFENARQSPVNSERMEALKYLQTIDVKNTDLPPVTVFFAPTANSGPSSMADQKLVTTLSFQ